MLVGSLPYYKLPMKGYCSLYVKCDMLYRLECVSLHICRNENSHSVFRSKQATSGQATCLAK